jgi:hypothetical protein
LSKEMPVWPARTPFSSAMEEVPSSVETVAPGGAQVGDRATGAILTPAARQE